MDLKEYIGKVESQWQTGDATEHSYRGLLQTYVQQIVGKGFVVVNEPSRIQCGAPDYVILRSKDNLPVFYIEAKDIGDSDLDGHNPKDHREQFNRYKGALERVVFTDYLDFHFYEQGEWIRNIRIGEIQGNKIMARKDAETLFEQQIQQWSKAGVQPVRSTTKLADIMAQKARLLRHVTQQTMLNITATASSYGDSQLLQLFNNFRSTLVGDLTEEGFADMYAQTIVYGLFAARLHDTTPENFSRAEAATLIPKSNPLLRRIFNNIAGIDLDDRVAWIVDDLVETFAATDVATVMKDYGSNGWRNDPMVHFYEDFLAGYDPKLRKDMGVWYTPKPVVGFIVRSVHEILKTQFGLPQGLADTSKIKTKDGNETHRLQILDPATGTATFLAEVIMQIYDVIGRKNGGLWQDYVEQELKPRLNGFELMMAPYTIAHLKLDMVLRETGYASTGDRRLNVFLTNALEPPSIERRILFNVLSKEAEAADKVKRDTPVMVVIGNPPYNGASRNQGKWIMQLMEAYKMEPGGKVKLKERNPKWINDDYVKFIRLAENYVEKNGVGIIGFINPHGFIDNPTFRGMRWQLLRTFDRVYVLNLHGNSKKKEVCPDGSKDENVFDIMQGVSINMLVKTGKKQANELGKVYYADLLGLKTDKFDFLDTHDIRNVDYKEVEPQEPMFFFVPTNVEGMEEYEKGFSIPELFTDNSVGVVTTKDEFLVCEERDTVKKRIQDLIDLPEADLAQKYKLKDTRDWSIQRAKEDVGSVLDESKIISYAYRPFDTKYLYYTGRTNGLVAWPRAQVQKQLLHEGNVAITVSRQCVSDWRYIFITENINDLNYIATAGRFGAGYVFPLYLYKEYMGKEEKIVNFNKNVYNCIADGLGYEPKPEEVLHYIYAVLHSPQYREKYKEFLKIDFPRVPYPKDKEEFTRLIDIGRKLVDLHLMHGADQWDVETGFPVSGSNVVERYNFDDGRVWINDTQYFQPVSREAWAAFIGGYQPAQKWLKDRKGRRLGYSDIIHYERIIHVLDSTLFLMQSIDEV